MSHANISLIVFSLLSPCHCCCWSNIIICSFFSSLSLSLLFCSLVCVPMYVCVMVLASVGGAPGSLLCYCWLIDWSIEEGTDRKWRFCTMCVWMCVGGCWYVWIIAPNKNCNNNSCFSYSHQQESSCPPSPFVGKLYKLFSLLFLLK